MKVPPAAGPAKYDRVWVQQLGPSDARQVLVLVPGTQGGAGGITPVARDIVRRVPRTQVWIVDRREQAFEDTSVFEGRNPDAALDYYLGFKYHSVKGADAKYVAEWGLATQLRDLRSVVKRAHAGGRRVILGGHSAGASTAVAYAAWDFGGHPGYRELDGLVLIDGGLLGASPRPTSSARRASWRTSAAATSSSTCSASASRRSPGSSPRPGRSTRTSGPTRSRRSRPSRCSRTSSSRASR